LYFVEFDDQGWLHPDRATVPDNGDASKQLDLVMEKLNQEMKDQKNSESPFQGISIVLFIHGWKHTAAFDDENVKRFRQVLKNTYAVEYVTVNKTGTKPRAIVGIYVGWRGQSFAAPEPLASLTFWDRKAAALHVAQGSARELLARLRGFQRAHNVTCQNPQGVTRSRCNIRMLLIGHSFGAWVLYSATAGWLIEAVASQQDVPQDPTPSLNRFSDMVVLVNPAFEGSRYEPLYRVAHSLQPRCYEPPLFVSVTSTADWATGSAFPAGRWVNSLLQRPTASDEQSEAITHTPGHIERYITHDLTKAKDNIAGQCRDWKDVTQSQKDLQELQEQAPSPENKPKIDKLKQEIQEQMQANIETEEKNEQIFFGQHLHGASLPQTETWTRPFCGGAVLTPHFTQGKVTLDPNVPVWNVSADASIINGHNDIDGVAFSSFIRQIYHELTQH
jgi:hypothetical protein